MHIANWYCNAGAVWYYIATVAIGYRNTTKVKQMAKTTKKAKPAASAAPAVPANHPPKKGLPHTPQSIINVTNIPFAGAGKNTARAKWYAHIVACNGKTVAHYTKTALANPPSLQPNGKYGLANKCEPPSGWLNWASAPINGHITFK